jgi:hypothetical protein
MPRRPERFAGDTDRWGADLPGRAVRGQHPRGPAESLAMRLLKSARPKPRPVSLTPRRVRPSCTASISLMSAMTGGNPLFVTR